MEKQVKYRVGDFPNIIAGGPSCVRQSLHYLSIARYLFEDEVRDLSFFFGNIIIQVEAASNTAISGIFDSVAGKSSLFSVPIPKIVYEGVVAAVNEVFEVGLGEICYSRQVFRPFLRGRLLQATTRLDCGGQRIFCFNAKRSVERLSFE
jgi:stage V sporulation protein SpoVS